MSWGLPPRALATSRSWVLGLKCGWGLETEEEIVTFYWDDCPYPLLLAFVWGDSHQAKPCGLPACFAPGTTYSIPLVFPLSCFGHPLLQANKSHASPESGHLLEARQGIKSSPKNCSPGLTFQQSQSCTSYNSSPGLLPRSCQSTQADSCHSLGIWPLSSLTPTCHQLGCSRI